MKRVLSILLTLALLAAVPASAAGAETAAGGRVSGAGSFSAVIREDGSLWTWGANCECLTEDGYIGYESEPTQVLTQTASVSAAMNHVLAVREDGSLWVWGQNSASQLGVATQGQPVKRPQKLLDGVRAAAAADLFSAAIRDDGSLWTWGSNFNYQLGTGDRDSRETPTKVLPAVTQVALGQAFTAAVDDRGALWTWGSNHYGQLGQGMDEPECETPRSAALGGVTAIAAGDQFLLALNGKGELYVCGSNLHGELGSGSTGGHRNWFAKVLDNVCAVSAADYTAAALRSDGTLWMWGGNAYGQISPDLPAAVATPTQVLTQVVEASAGDTHTLAVRTDGNLWAWGLLEGPGRQKSAAAPAQVMDKVLPADQPDLAYPSRAATVDIDGVPTALCLYALRDAGGETNYVRIRDLAAVLNGTQAQFNVDWQQGKVALLSHSPYATPNGTEGKSPFTGPQPIAQPAGATLVDGAETGLDGFVLHDGKGGHTFYQLRDLGRVLGFTVGWSRERGVYIETAQP